jgi:hypothetical protein
MAQQSLAFLPPAQEEVLIMDDRVFGLLTDFPVIFEKRQFLTWKTVGSLSTYPTMKQARRN